MHHHPQHHAHPAKISDDSTAPDVAEEFVRQHLRARGKLVELIHRIDLSHLDRVPTPRREAAVDGRRVDGVHMDAARAALHGEGGGKRGHGRLSSAVQHSEWVGDVRGRAGREDDTAPLRFGQHARVEIVAEMHIGREVTVKVGEVRACLVLLEHSGHDVARVEEDNLDALVAYRGLDVLHPRAIRLRQVCPNLQDLPIGEELAQISDRLIEDGFITRHQYHVDPLIQQLARQLLADAT
mmetsp:Transcript_60846/g.135589  ORF Transcript_60846/g.135589 Transcript_60846/m.135589 type:complete len:239 (-) Transcript_60846:132-848(-)